MDIELFTRLQCSSYSPRSEKTKFGRSTDGCTKDCSTTPTKALSNLLRCSFQDLAFTSYITKNVSK